MNMKMAKSLTLNLYIALKLKEMMVLETLEPTNVMTKMIRNGTITILFVSVDIAISSTRRAQSVLTLKAQPGREM